MTFYLIWPKCSLDYCVCVCVCVCTLATVEVVVSKCVFWWLCTSLSVTYKQYTSFPSDALLWQSAHLCSGGVWFGGRCVPGQRDLTDNNPNLFDPSPHFIWRSQTDMRLSELVLNVHQTPEITGCCLWSNCSRSERTIYLVWVPSHCWELISCITLILFFFVFFHVWQPAAPCS